MNTLTPAKLKTWARENRSLAKAVCAAKAFAELERARVDAYVQPIFERYDFRDDETGEPVTSVRDLYLSEQDDLFAEFDAEVIRAHAANGWEGPEGHCPALVAESQLVDAENALLVSLGEFTGLGNGFVTTSLDMRAKGLDLALTTCLGTVL